MVGTYSIVLGNRYTFSLFSDIRQRLGKRPYSPEKAFSSNQVVRREPSSDVHSRLGVPRQDVKGLYSDTRERKSGEQHFTLVGRKEWRAVVVRSGVSAYFSAVSITAFVGVSIMPTGSLERRRGNTSLCIRLSFFFF